MKKLVLAMMLVSVSAFAEGTTTTAPAANTAAAPAAETAAAPAATPTAKTKKAKKHAHGKKHAAKSEATPKAE